MSIYKTSHCFIPEEQNFYAETSPSTLIMLKQVKILPHKPTLSQPVFEHLFFLQLPYCLWHINTFCNLVLNQIKEQELSKHTAKFGRIL